MSIESSLDKGVTSLPELFFFKKMRSLLLLCVILAARVLQPDHDRCSNARTVMIRKKEIVLYELEEWSTK